MAGSRRRTGTRSDLPLTRYQRALAIPRDRLRSTVVAIENANRSLMHRVDREIEAAQNAGSSGSVMGSAIQVPESDPRYEQAIDYLETVKKTLEELVSEAP